MTNFERIKGMNLDEFTSFIESIVFEWVKKCDICAYKYEQNDYCVGSCRDGIAKWMLREGAGLTLDEAIERAERRAEEDQHVHISEHAQIAEWLKELKGLREDKGNND